MNKKIILSIVALMLIQTILAVAPVSQTDTFYVGDTQQKVTNVQEMIFSCANSLCSSQGSLVVNGNSGASNIFSFDYPSNPSSTQSNPNYYAHFSFANCYLPKEYIESIWGYNYYADYEYGMEKAEDCHSPIDSFSVTNQNYVNEPVVIKMVAAMEADVYSAFTDLNLNWFPNSYKNYYSVETKVILEVKDKSGKVVYTESKNLNLLMDTKENVQFSWTPSEKGDYTARVTTQITDCQCSSTINQFSEKQFLVHQERPLNECYTILNDLVASPQFATPGEQVAISFTKLSNYADSNFVKTPIPTKAEIEIRDSNNNVVYSNSRTVPANSNNFATQNVIFNWIPSKAGEFNVKVKGVASSNLCSGLPNPAEVLILGFIVENNISQTHNVKFVVTNSNTGAALSNAIINFGDFDRLTDSNGEVTFEVVEGFYTWQATHSGYSIKTGSAAINADKTISVALVPTPVTPQTHNVKFIVTDSITGEPLLNSQVSFGARSGFTDATGAFIFGGVQDGTYSWQVLYSGYTTKTGSTAINEDKTIRVALVPTPVTPATHKVTFVVTNSNTGAVLSNSNVVLGTLNGVTDSTGKITFTIAEGTYSWSVAHSGYTTKTGSTFVNSDKVIDVALVEGVTTVSVLYPNGGEVSGTINILWSVVNGLGNPQLISVSYSFNNGGSWMNLAQNLANTGSYAWNTKQVSDRNYKIKICAEDQLTQKDVCALSGEFAVKNENGNGEPEEPFCGDGIKDSGEECDDGNLINDDGCSSVCKIEEPEEPNEEHKLSASGFKFFDFGTPGKTKIIAPLEAVGISNPILLEEESKKSNLFLWLLILCLILLIILLILIAVARKRE